MTKKRKILVGAAVIIVILAVWGLIQKANAKKDDVKDAAPKYYVTKVSRPTPFSLNGQVESKQVSTLGLPSGKVQEIRVKNGQSVHKGDVILKNKNQKKKFNRNWTRQKERSSPRSRVSILQNSSWVRHRKKMTATAIFKIKSKKHRALMMMLFLR